MRARRSLIAPRAHGILDPIDDEQHRNTPGPQPSPGQGELSIELARSATTRRDRLRARLRAARTTVRHRPRHAAALVAAFVARWVLRIALPIAGAGVMLHMFPYRAAAGGVHFQIQGTIWTRSGLSADTTFGNWEFKHVTLLPVGVHITPENVDVVRLASAVTQDGQAYVDKLRDGMRDQAATIVLWLVGETLIGIVAGLGVAAAINLAVRHLRGRPRRRREVRLRVRQLAAGLIVTALVAAFGAITYNPKWTKDSRVTGTLAALQLFPGQLQAYYNEHTKAVDVLTAIATIQSGLQQQIEAGQSSPNAFNIMFISDMHLAATYPLVKRYAANYHVRLIINTGDESAFGTAAEMTPAYLNQIKELTQTVPMIWLAGNHDSPTTVSIMSSIPGVTVLGTKTVDGDRGFTVTADKLNAFGLTIAGMSDPRVYGGPGDFGSNDSKVVHALERRTVDAALRGVPSSAHYDIFATHEPVAAEQAAKDMTGRIRQLNAGHEHKQNPDNEVQPDDGGMITLVEGSTGAGGLDTLSADKPRVPIEFSIESVSEDCQFTKVVRFQLSGQPGANTAQVPAADQNISATTLYLDPQQIPKDRTCSASLGLTTPRPVAP